MLRVVFDTNIFVSKALIPHGQPAQAFTAWRELRCQLLVSPPILAEVRHTLGYARIRRKYAITDEIVDQLIQILVEYAILVEGEADVIGAVPDDPDDEIILACAIDGKADLIVSGDRHLLDLDEYRGVPIVTVRDFLNRLSPDRER
jgi:putative PIN family toxin of toxin-antitoxin system